MQKVSLVGHIIEVYSDFARNSEVPADAVLRRFFLNRKYLGSGDRRAIATAYFASIKNFLRLEAIAQDAFPSDEHKPELVISAYFIVFTGEDPERMRSYLSELPNEFNVEYPRHVFAALADRNREEGRLAALEFEERLSIFYSFPQWFVREVSREYGKDKCEPLLNALNSEAPTVMRVNTLITARDQLREELATLGIETELSTVSDDGLILRKRLNVWDLHAFKRGAFELQDEASQLVARFADIHSKRIKVLDACAGAGGKALHFSALLENLGEIYATDVDPRKLDELKKRVVRSHAQNIRIIPPDKYEQIIAVRPEWFDIVLLDVPCSGTGTLRRNPSIKWNLTETMLSELLIKQQAILERNMQFVKRGGVLLYATCSLLRSEGEDQVEWFTKTHPEFSIEEMKRTHPDSDGCDGFFAARLRKN